MFVSNVMFMCAKKHMLRENGIFNLKKMEKYLLQFIIIVCIDSHSFHSVHGAASEQRNNKHLNGYRQSLTYFSARKSLIQNEKLSNSYVATQLENTTHFNNATTSANSTGGSKVEIMSDKEKRRNLIILYATIFTTVGFVLAVIICVVVVGCRRSEMNIHFSNHHNDTINDGSNTKRQSSRKNNGVLNGQSKQFQNVMVKNGVIKMNDMKGKADGLSSADNKRSDIETTNGLGGRGYDNKGVEP